MKATPLPPAPRFEEHFDLSTSVGAQNLVPPLFSTSVLCLASGVEGLGPPGLSSKPKDLSSKLEDLRLFLARALCAQVPGGFQEMGFGLYSSEKVFFYTKKRILV